MSTQLFVQKFSQGQPVPMPYDAVVDCVSQYGALGRGPVGDVEIAFEGDAIAHYGLLVGDAAQGVQCVALIRPITDAAMRRLAFDLMSRFGACLFDDALGCVCVVDHPVADLPAEFLAACATGVQRIASPQQIWPDGLMLGPRAKESPALIFDNPNPQGGRYVLFDGAELEKKHLTMVFGLRPEACNAATLRALRNMLLKVDIALSSNPEFQVFYRFAHHEAQLQLLESPQIAESRNGGTFVMSGEALLLQEEPQPLVAFRLEPDLYFLNREKSAELRKRALADFGITVEPSVTGLAALDDVLERVHKRYRLECNGVPAGHAFSEDALRWAVLAGAFLGERIRIGIGGQWGYAEVMEHRIPVVQTHTERICWPQQRVLQRIINGASDSVVGYFDELLQNAKSSTRPDIVADIPLLSHIMAGRGRFSGDGLPLQAQLPASQLDFSVESLRALDVYLAAVHAQLGSFQTDDLNNLTLGAGAYIGEVLRRHLSKNWAWMNYADYFRTRPPNPELPKDINSKALLVGAGFVVLPMQAGNVRAWGSSPHSAFAQVVGWLQHFEPMAEPAQAEPAQADTVGPEASVAGSAGLVAQRGVDAAVGADTEAKDLAMDAPSVTAAKEQVLHVVESPVPASDDKAWSYLDKILEREEARLLSLKPSLLGKWLGKKPDSSAKPPKTVFVKYLGRMAKEYPGVYDAAPDMTGDVLTLTVASESVNYVVETARREFGLTVFDSNRFNIIYRPASQE